MPLTCTFTKSPTSLTFSLIVATDTQEAPACPPLNMKDMLRVMPWGGDFEGASPPALVSSRHLACLHASDAPKR